MNNLNNPLAPEQKLDLAQRLELFLLRELIWALKDCRETDPSVSVDDWFRVPGRADLIARLTSGAPASHLARCDADAQSPCQTQAQTEH